MAVMNKTLIIHHINDIDNIPAMERWFVHHHCPEVMAQAVLDHINQAQSRVENTKGQIKRVLALLKKMREDVDVQIADEKEKQEQLAVETEL